MSTPQDSRRDEIVQAAVTIFSHYGYRRASLEEIAREAGISRSGLYHHFANKEEIFRAMSEHLHCSVLTEAERIAKTTGLFEERLLAVLEAKLGWMFGLLAESRHGVEIIDESSRLCGEDIAAFTRRYLKIIASIIRGAVDSGEIALTDCAMTPDSAAAFLYNCARGLQGEPPQTPSPKQYRKRLEQLVRVTVVGWR